MRRATEVKRSSDWGAARPIDRVTLASDDRHRRRLVMTGEAGTRFLLDLPQAARLRDGDGLVLDDGSIVRVVGKPEPLVEIEAPDAAARLRIAWHIGNRHVPAELDGTRILIRDDHVIVAMVEGLGGHVRHVRAPFTPEGGAYAAHAHAGEENDGHI